MPPDSAKAPCTAMDFHRLAFDHHRRAEQALSAIDRDQFHRAAEIYSVLASFDRPIALLPGPTDPEPAAAAEEPLPMTR